MSKGPWPKNILRHNNYGILVSCRSHPTFRHSLPYYYCYDSFKFGNDDKKNLRSFLPKTSQSRAATVQRAEEDNIKAEAATGLFCPTKPTSNLKNVGMGLHFKTCTPVMEKIGFYRLHIEKEKKSFVPQGFISASCFGLFLPPLPLSTVVHGWVCACIDRLSVCRLRLFPTL